jgi:HNH endonuclease
MKNTWAHEGPAVVEEFFWTHVNTNGPTVRPELGCCWLWTGKTLPEIDGKFGVWGNYGSASFHGDSEPAHRLSWYINNGTIHGRLWVLHHCDNPPCVRPEHLFLGTVLDNNHDRMAKGRFYNGGCPRLVRETGVGTVQLRRS